MADNTVVMFSSDYGPEIGTVIHSHLRLTPE
jgi:hypothetical protein